MLNYYEIGQRIRKYRKACQLSQEELADRVNISATHMSHIETGNTKLSLTVLVALAAALEVSTDELLFGNDLSSGRAAQNEMTELLETCSPRQAQVLRELIRAAKTAMDKYL